MSLLAVCRKQPLSEKEKDERLPVLWLSLATACDTLQLCFCSIEGFYPQLWLLGRMRSASTSGEKYGGGLL